MLPGSCQPTRLGYIIDRQTTVRTPTWRSVSGSAALLEPLQPSLWVLAGETVNAVRARAIGRRVSSFPAALSGNELEKAAAAKPCDG